MSLHGLKAQKHMNSLVETKDHCQVSNSVVGSNIILNYGLTFSLKLTSCDRQATWSVLQGFLCLSVMKYKIPGHSAYYIGAGNVSSFLHVCIELNHIPRPYKIFLKDNTRSHPLWFSFMNIKLATLTYYLLT